ncbi:MAG: LLM class flavin-dependent oxidoreductase [Chloroflexota bacterium]|nr:MAG: LLM class flavin-dependent oxidoreductase [Chloroflexota bacterium]
MAKLPHKITFGSPGIQMPPLDNVIRLAQRNEEQGYEIAWWPDHLMGFYPSSLWTPDLTDMALTQENPHLYLDPFVAMAAAGLHTKTIKIGTLVTEPLRRHPAVLAQSFLSVDHASKGRCIAGIGTGEGLNTLPYGIPFDKPVSRLAEALKIIRMLWETDQPVSYEGEFWTLKDAVLGLGPYNPGKYPPIWVASHGPRMLEITGQFGDGWIPQMLDPQEYGSKLKQIRQAAGKAGRDPNAIRAGLTALLVIAKTHEEAHKLLENPFVKVLSVLFPSDMYLKYAGVPHPLGHPFNGFNSWIPTRFSREAALEVIDKIPSEVVHETIFHGSPEDLAEQVINFGHQGMQHAALWNMTYCAGMDHLRPSFNLMVELLKYVDQASA